MEYTIQPTKGGQFIVRNPMGNECAKLNTQAEAEAWISGRHAWEAEREADQAQASAEQEQFNAAVPDLNQMQTHWQTWRNWFYDNLVHEGRRLEQQRRHMDNIPDGEMGQPGTSSSPSYANSERWLTRDQQAHEQANALYAEAMQLDSEIKAARRAQNRVALAARLADAEDLIERMRWSFHTAWPADSFPWLTPGEIAAMTHTAESTWRNKAADGQIPGAVKKGKQWLVPRAWVREQGYNV